MINYNEEAVEREYSRILKKVAVVSIILFLIISTALFLIFKESSEQNRGRTGFTLKCLENYTVCDNESGNCHYPNSSDINRCLGRE